MANGVQLIAEIEPKNSGSFALLDDKYLRGGLKVVETYDELATISSDRLKDGCLVMVTTPSRILYVYDETLNEWTQFSTGGGGNDDVWTCVEDGETTKFVKDVDAWTQKITVINHVRTYTDYFTLPTEYVQNNEIAYCKTDVIEGITLYKKGFYYYDINTTSWIELTSSVDDSKVSEKTTWSSQKTNKEIEKQHQPYQEGIALKSGEMYVEKYSLYKCLVDVTAEDNLGFSLLPEGTMELIIGNGDVKQCEYDENTETLFLYKLTTDAIEYNESTMTINIFET